MKRKFVLGAAAALLLLGGISQVRAEGTLADTDITNTATVDYTVGGIGQPTLPSNTVTFETDRRINLFVSEFGGAYSDVTPGETERVLRFNVLNETNDIMDFRLTATNDGLGVADPFGGFDDFDPNTVTVFVDNGDDTFVALDDTATFIDELPPDMDVTVFIVSNIQGGLADQFTAGLTLTAYAAVASGAGLGADYSEDTGLDDPNAVETVFGDPAGETGDIDGDGFHSDKDAYRAVSATVTATKTTTVISDPFNLGVNPKRIPGAVIEYCIVVSNTGGTDATSVVISDDLLGQAVTYVPSSLIVGGAADCTGGASEDDDALGGDEIPIGANFTGTVATFNVGTIAASGTTSVRFQVTIVN
jgi:uncharacterized repeat protein (TIGR01451 family)